MDFHQVIYPICSVFVAAPILCVLARIGYRKIPKISPGAYIFQRPFLRGLSTEGNLRFTNDWASLQLEVNLPFSLFYFVFKGNFPSTSPWGAYISRCDLMAGFLRYHFGGLVFGGAYFQNFTVLQVPKTKLKSYGDRRFSIAGPKLWNSIHASLRNADSLNSFKKHLKTFLFHQTFS